ncbi:hypothetical protein PG996_002798 [Apiospora saccharicola]|uniref:Heterokaryon incompatibility domain-containing protein n=1 Tax=Apiospora saccharicola TaxID=335842 RepID=A0ABR1WKJ6_9PEZI
MHDAIRLLRLCKDDFGTSIRCEIFEAFIDDNQRLPYEALSYVWGLGGSKPWLAVTINGHDVTVTDNLFGALYNLRQSDHDRILWVDALCINQGDNKEKGHQLTNRRWFRRIWIIQEVGMAERAKVICGRRSIGSNTFSLIPSLMGVKMDFLVHAVLEMMPGWLRLQSPSSQDRRLITLLRRFKDSESSLQQDRVYALIGLASDTLDFPVDYDISFQQLISNIALRRLTGSFHHNIPLKVSYDWFLAVYQEGKELFRSLFHQVLEARRADILLLMVRRAPQTQRYMILEMISHYDYPALDAVISEFIPHPLNWPAGSSDTVALTEAFYAAALLSCNLFLTRSIAAVDHFIVDVNTMRRIVRRERISTPMREVISDTIKSSLRRLVQRHRQCCGMAKSPLHAYQPTCFEQWTRQMLPLVMRFEDAGATKLLLEEGQYPDTEAIKQARTHAILIASRGDNDKAEKKLVDFATAELFSDLELGKNHMDEELLSSVELSSRDYYSFKHRLGGKAPWEHELGEAEDVLVEEDYLDKNGCWLEKCPCNIK